MGWSPTRAQVPAPRWNHSNHNLSLAQREYFRFYSRDMAEEINVLNDSVYQSILPTYSSQVAKINASQQIVAPLKMKNRQFLARNLELSARNKQLESGRRNVSNSVSVSNNGPREREKHRTQQKKFETKIHIKRVR